MGKIEGQALYTGTTTAAWLDEPARRRAGESFIDVLAALHSLNPDIVGLGDLGPADGYIARQLRTWYGSWTASVAAANYDDRRVHDLHDQFSASIPVQVTTRIVHGDHGPHNSLFSRVVIFKGCSTGRSPHSATRSQISRTPSTRGRNPPTA